MPVNYPQDFQDRALPLATEAEADRTSQWSAVQQITTQLGITPETLRRWFHQAEIDSGCESGASTTESTALTKLRTENAVFNRAKEILTSTSASFRRVSRPSHHEIIRYIDAFRNSFGSLDHLPDSCPRRRLFHHLPWLVGYETPTTIYA